MDDRRAALERLLQRVDEVRGMSGRGDARVALEPGDSGALIETLHELVEELERSHRRLIETNVQLVSLREVSSHLVSALDTGETTRTVTRYLSRAFGYDDVFLLLVDRDRALLDGAWTRRDGERDHSWNVSVPLAGDHGAAARALWLNRTLVQQAAVHHPALILPDGHPVRDAVESMGPVVCVPLQRSHAGPPVAEPHELCGARCIVGDVALLAPPPGPAAGRWAIEREERQQHCVRCDLNPLLGVIGMARRGSQNPRENGDVEMIESIALSVAPMIENARLYQDLRRSERFREHVLDSMTSALVAVSMSGEILTFNRTAEELLGFAAGDVVGRRGGELFGPDAESLLRDALEQGRTVRREEVLLRTENGGVVPVSLSTSLLRNDRRTVIGAIATFVDLTPFKRAEEHARRLDRLAALGRFTSSVAHEIRNPLTGIAAGVQYLTRALAPTGPDAENLAFIQREVKRLDQILQDLFDITHPRGLRMVDGAVEDTARRALQCLEALLGERKVSAAIEVASRTPPVPHDHDQMEQVFLNLMKNAIEASPPGAHLQVRVLQAAPAASATGSGAVAIRIEDQGGGIPVENLKTVFEPFFTTKQGGSGLGLYISHDIVKRHGGSITVHSTPGQGTTFTVELPMEHSGGRS